MIHRPFSLFAAAGLAASAAAQQPSFTSDSTISMPLSWSEVNGNNNGLLEPGESAAIVMNLSFTNQFGIAQFSPSIGTFTSGTILGLGSGFIDLDGAGGTSGAFNLGLPPGGPLNNGETGYGVRSGWRIVGAASHGSVNGAGAGITQIQFGQFPSIKLPSPSSIVRLYALLWTPSDYRARAVTFAIAGHAPPTIASLYLDLDGQVGASAYVIPANIALGAVTIPIAPAPPALALPMLALLALRRRAHPARSHAARPR